MNQAAQIGIILGAVDIFDPTFFFKASLSSFGVTTYVESVKHRRGTPCRRVKGDEAHRRVARKAAKAIGREKLSCEHC
jgi:hypothetical protein